MEFNLTNLITNLASEINIDEEIIIPDEMFKLTNIRRLDNVHFKGRITKLYDEEFEITGKLSLEMVLPDDITLEDVVCNLNIDIEERFTEYEEDNENNLIIVQNKLDIIPFLWQNIVVEIPLKVVKDQHRDIKLKGDGWRLITMEEYEAENSSNSPFSDLQELIDSRKEW